MTKDNLHLSYEDKVLNLKKEKYTLITELI